MGESLYPDESATDSSARPTVYEQSPLPISLPTGDETLESPFFTGEHIVWLLMFCIVEEFFHLRQNLRLIFSHLKQIVTMVFLQGFQQRSLRCHCHPSKNAQTQRSECSYKSYHQQHSQTQWHARQTKSYSSSCSTARLVYLCRLAIPFSLHCRDGSFR